MAVVINYTEEDDVKSRSSSSKKVPQLNTTTHFLLYVTAFVIGFIGSILFKQYPDLDVTAVLLPIPKNIVTTYTTYDISFGDSFSDKEVVDIKESLLEMKLDETPRFRFTPDSKLKIVYSKYNENALYSSSLLTVGHKYWVKDSVLSEDIPNYEIVVAKGSAKRIKSILSTIYSTDNISITEVDDVVKKLELEDEKKYLGLVTFDELNEQLQLLKLDNKYFLDMEDGGAIMYSVDISGDLPDHIRSAVSRNTSILKGDSLDRENLLKVNMTGVTAITRGLIPKIESSGDYGYPAKKIGSFLADADLTHTSNEVSFVDGCSYSVGLRFCSKPEYLKTLKDSGVDIVELTGNHNNDYGSQVNAATIEIYKEAGMEYFGGGVNLEDASKPLIKDMKGSKVAFMGYNYYDSIPNTLAIAGQTRAGANLFSFEKMQREIEEAKKVADVVIVTFQFQECYSYPPSDVIYPICYKALSSPDQKAVFRRAVEYGADIVIGTQAHQPQTFEVYNGKVIYYGLGNLYFDQINWIGTRQGLVLTHYLYNGKLLQTKITTTLYDNAMQPYVSEGEDKELLLELLKQAR